MTENPEERNALPPESGATSDTTDASASSDTGDVSDTGASASSDTGDLSDTADASDTGEVVPDALFPSVTSSDPRVADALSRLDEADRLPLPEQVAVYADIHRRLASVLADPDSQA